MEAPRLLGGVQRVVYCRRVRSPLIGIPLTHLLNFFLGPPCPYRLNLDLFIKNSKSYMWAHLKAFRSHYNHIRDLILPPLSFFLGVIRDL